MKNALVLEEIPGFGRIAVTDRADVVIGTTRMTFRQFEQFSIHLDKAYDKAATIFYRKEVTNEAV